MTAEKYQYNVHQVYQLHISINTKQKKLSERQTSQ